MRRLKHWRVASEKTNMLLPSDSRASAAPGAAGRGAAARRLAFIGVVAGLLALALLLADLAGIPPGELTPDPNSVAEQSTYVGIISTLGVMAWGAIIAACLLAGAVLHAIGGERPRLRFMLTTAAFALILGVDDAAMFHENVAPDTLGVPERAVLVFFAALAFAWIVVSWSELRRSDLVLLLATGACFAVSVVVDQFYKDRVFEDFFKYVGLVAFMAWAFLEARTSLVMGVRQS